MKDYIILFMYTPILALPYYYTVTARKLGRMDE